MQNATALTKGAAHITIPLYVNNERDIAMLERNSFVILSAELNSCTPESNDRCTRAMAYWLRDNGYCYKQVTGVYKGTKENSFVIPVECREDVNALRQIAHDTFLQESILLVSGLTKEAVLLFAYASPLPLGKWQQVADSNGLDGYTVDNYNVYACI